MLGEAVYDEFVTTSEVAASDIVPRTEWLSHVDVSDYEQFRDAVLSFKPDVLINLAAETDLEQCELDPDTAWKSNAIGAEHGALLAAELDVPYVYISTAGIFDGSQKEYLDYDEPNPLTVYARSKLHGERFTERTLRKYFVLRAGWMMGGGPSLDKKFVNKIYQQIRGGARELHCVTDKFGTPTYTIDFAKGVRRILDSNLFGTYNQVCSGSASRFEVAHEFVRLLNMESEIAVTPVSSDFFTSEYFARRPESEQLVNHKLSARGMNVMRPWRTALSDYSSVFLQDLAAARG